MAKKLNIPMIGTFVVEYVTMGLFIITSFYFFANNLTILNSIIFGIISSIYTYSHDPLYCILFPDMIAKVKMNYRYTMKDFWELSRVFIQNMLTIIIAAHFKLIHFNYTNFSETFIEISVQYWAMILLKDYTMMYFLHPWMHKPENYWIHKHHHKVGLEVQANHAFSIDMLDLFIENQVGLFLFYIISWLIYDCISVHYMSFVFLGWHDIMVHSLNPYSVVHFNPILEYWHKPTLEHNLHHMIQKDYYVFDSFRHLWDINRRDQDLAKYNELCRTRINFDFFVDENDNIAY